MKTESVAAIVGDDNTIMNSLRIIYNYIRYAFGKRNILSEYVVHNFGRGYMEAEYVTYEY